MRNMGNKYSWQVLLIISILMIIGLIILYTTGVTNLNNFKDLYNYIDIHGFEAIISLFFIGVGVYCWYLYIINVIIKPKEEILYLNDIEDNICEFINKKGKKFFYNDNNYQLHKFYVVLKTKNKIDKVINETTSSFDLPRIKESYWLNFYSPVGNFENIFLLPIAYVIAIPGILILIMSESYSKIFGIIYLIIPVYIIIYDLIYKIKKKQNNYEEIDESALLNSYVILIKSIKVIGALVVSIILTILFINTKDAISRLILLPFFLCGLAILGNTIASVTNNKKLEKIFYKIYIVIFLTFWFSILTIGCIVSIKNNVFSMIIFTIPFWAVGIFMIYKFFIKK